MWVYYFLNVFFFIFHTVLTLFNLFGWIWRKTRRWNLLTLSLTAFSWTVLGIWYGFGYCPCTDWHWKVRWELGYYDMPRSYLKFLVDSLTGLNVNAGLIDTLAIIFFSLAFLLSIILNIRGYLHSKNQSMTDHSLKM